MQKYLWTLAPPRPSQAPERPAATSEIAPTDLPEILHPTLSHPPLIAAPGVDRDPAAVVVAGTPTAPPPDIRWADALGPNETFSSPLQSPTQSTSYSSMSSPREMPDADEGPPDGEPDPRADDNLPSGDGGSVPLLCTRKQRQLSTSLHAKAAAAFHSFARASGGSFPLLCTCRRRQLSTSLHAQSEQHLSASLHAQAEAAFHFFARADSGSFPLLCTRRRR